MKTSDPKRRRSEFRPGAESLETRQVLSAGAGNTIAIMPEAIKAPGVAQEVAFKVGGDSFQSKKGSVLLGIDVVPTSSSTADPAVASIQDSGGKKVKSSTYATSKPITYNGKPITPAVVGQFSIRKGKGAATSQAYKANVVGKSQTSGSFLAGFYLVGDANGDGKVQRRDVNLVRKALNSKAGDSNYSFDADANRDGRVTSKDLSLAQQNVGVRTNILPLITADLDPTSDTGTQDRVTRNSTVQLSGVASSNATVSYKEVDNKTAAVQVTADPSGRYTVNIPLAQGSNKFQVTAEDSFGQSISGTIAAITYKPDATT